MKNSQWQIASDDLLLDENQASQSHGSYFIVLPHQKYFTKHPIFIIFRNKEKFVARTRISKDKTQIQGISKALDFFAPFNDFPGFSRTVATLFISHISRVTKHSTNKTRWRHEQKLR